VSADNKNDRLIINDIGSKARWGRRRRQVSAQHDVAVSLGNWTPPSGLRSETDFQSSIRGQLLIAQPKSDPAFIG